MRSVFKRQELVVSKKTFLLFFALFLTSIIQLPTSVYATPCRRIITCPTDPEMVLTCVGTVDDNGGCDITPASNPTCSEQCTYPTPQNTTPAPTSPSTPSSTSNPSNTTPPSSGSPTQEEQVIYKLNQDRLPKEAVPEKKDEDDFLSQLGLKFNSFWNQITGYFYQRPQQPPKTYVESNSLESSVGIGVTRPITDPSEQLNQDLIDTYGKDLPPFPTPIEPKAHQYEYYYDNSQFPDGLDIIVPAPSGTPSSTAQ